MEWYHWMIHYRIDLFIRCAHLYSFFLAKLILLLNFHFIFIYFYQFTKFPLFIIAYHLLSMIEKVKKISWISIFYFFHFDFMVCNWVFVCCKFYEFSFFICWLWEVERWRNFLHIWRQKICNNDRLDVRITGCCPG